MTEGAAPQAFPAQYTLAETSDAETKLRPGTAHRFPLVIWSGLHSTLVQHAAQLTLLAAASKSVPCAFVQLSSI